MVRVKTTYILTLIAEENPYTLRSAVSDLRRWLHDEEDAVKLNASNVLMNISEECPEEVVPTVDELVRLLRTELSPEFRDDILYHSTEALSNVAEEYPQETVSAVDSVVPLLTEDSVEVRINSSYLLFILSEMSPETVKLLVGDVIQEVDDSNDVVKGNLLLTLSNVAEEYPEKSRPALRKAEGSLDSADSQVREAALQVLLVLAQEYPEDVVEMDESLRGLLNDESKSVRTIVALLFGGIAAEKPERVKPVIEELQDLTNDTNDIVRYSPLPAIAAVEPELLREDVDTLRNALNRNEWLIRTSATDSLLEIAREYPEDVRPATDGLIDVFREGEEEEVIGAAGALAVIAREYPEDVEPATGELSRLMDSEDGDLRLNSIFAVAEVSPGRARDYAGELRRAMNSKMVTEREGATRAVASIAKQFPGDVRSLTDKLQELTDDPDERVRRNAELALKHLSEKDISHSPINLPSPDKIPEAPELSLTYDKMEKEGHVGKGGNADVHLVSYHGTDIALKEPRMSGTLHTETAKRFMEEAKTWEKLDDHDGIVGVVDYGSEPLPWIALEYMDGGSLDQRFGEMEPEEKVWLVGRICEGVQYAHTKGVAHLDLKPENILFRETDAEYPDIPKVADWGLSKVLLENSKSVDGVSPQYAAPEQFESERYGSPDTKTDIYQLGTIFYEIFTDTKPFEGQTFEVMNQIQNRDPTPPSELTDIPVEIDGVLLKALSKRKEDRQESVLYLRDGIQEAFGL